MEQWQRILVDRELNDRNLADVYPENLETRLAIQRADLDSCIVTGGGSWRTLLVSKRVEQVVAADSKHNTCFTVGCRRKM